MSKIFNALNRADKNLQEAVWEALEERPRTVPPEPRRPPRPPGPASEPSLEKVLRVNPSPAQEPSLLTEDAWAEVWERPLWRSAPGAAPLLSLDDEHRRAMEEYKIIRTRLLQHPARPAVIAISSPCIGDGKTVTAIHLAAALAAKSEGRVLLIDADLRRPAIHRHFHVGESPGLSDVLRGTSALKDSVFRYREIANLHVLLSGNRAENPTELLDSAAWRDTVDAAREGFAKVVVDCPPVEALADFDLISATCDGVVMVVRPDHTNRSLWVNALKRTKKSLLGVVLNDAANWFLWKRYTAHYYNHYAPTPLRGR